MQTEPCLQSRHTFSIIHQYQVFSVTMIIFTQDDLSLNLTFIRFYTVFTVQDANLICRLSVFNKTFTWKDDQYFVIHNSIHTWSVVSFIDSIVGISFGFIFVSMAFLIHPKKWWIDEMKQFTEIYIHMCVNV